jgi:hypothetical protein
MVPHTAPAPVATQEAPPFCVTPAGSVSAIDTLVAFDGPPLVRTIT